MSNYTNSATSSDFLWTALQEQQSQSQKNQKQDNDRESSRLRKDYHNGRAESAALSTASSKQEALNKTKAQVRVRTTGALKEDSILPSSSGDLGMFKSKLESKPPVPAPNSPFGSNDDSDDGSLSIIAILAKVLVLQAKTNSQVWQVLWKQSSDFMSMSYNMAKAQASATQSQWDEQSQATKTQAKMDMESGAASLCAFGATLVMAAGMPVEDTVETAGEGDGRSQGTIKTEEPSNETEMGTEPTEVAQESGQRAITQSESSSSKTFENVKEEGKKGLNMLQKAMKRVGNAAQAAQLTSMASQGMIGVAITGPKGATKAMHEKLAGQHAATAQLAQGVMEYYNQNYSRSEEIRQSANQNLEYAMQVYKAASDAVTQAVSAMYSR